MRRNEYCICFFQDLYTLDFDIYKQYGCNITALQLTDTYSQITRDWIDKLKSAINEDGHPPMLPTNGIQVTNSIQHPKAGQFLTRMAVVIFRPNYQLYTTRCI